MPVLQRISSVFGEVSKIKSQGQYWCFIALNFRLLKKINLLPERFLNVQVLATL
jgi:hypothetical protein